MTEEPLSFQIPSEVMQRVSAVVKHAGEGGMSRAEVEKRSTGKGARFVRPACEELLRTGFVREADRTGRGGGRPLVHVKDWTAGKDDKLRVKARKERDGEPDETG